MNAPTADNSTQSRRDTDQQVTITDFLNICRLLYSYTLFNTAL